MGETDEKENVPAETPTAEIEEPKETEKLLNKDEKNSGLESPTETKSDNLNPPAEEAKPDETAPEKVNGDEVIEIPESSEKSEKADKKAKGEGREVKPRKIPIGGIKMPGFFTKKPKPAETDGAEGELLENAGNEAKSEEKAKESENSAPASGRPSFLASLPKVSVPPLPKFRNPFAKKANIPKDEEAGETPAEETIGDKTEETEGEKNKFSDEAENEDIKKEKLEKEPLTEPKGENEPAPPSTKKNILHHLPAIRLPQLANIIPKRLRSNNQQTEDLELGNGPNNKAGLASMETLDDSIKDNETNKDVTDKAAVPEDGLETVKLNESAKEKEKEAEKEKDNGKIGETEVIKRPIFERIRAYHCSVDDLAIIGGILVFLLLVAIICIFTFTGNPALKSPPLRDGKFIQAITSCGPVEGVLEDSSYAFRGIPYAVPPINQKRFRPAELIERIDDCWNGTLKAHNSTPVCWQIFANGSVDGTEDCLNLDVITPYVRYDNPLPVVVLIGAESLTGDSPNKLRPSARFARSRDVVFVRPNFRVGVFGFLALNSLSKSVRPPTSGNYALSDILAALRWIQLNIVHFGGNPNAVTLFGHRAGATIVSALITSPQSKGLFARAWVSSGAAIFPGRQLIESERANNLYLEQVKCPQGECLHTTEAEELLDAVPDTWRRVWPDLPTIDENTTARHEWLVLDGNILQKHPADVWNREPGPPQLVIGTSAHESHSEKLLLKYKQWTPELVRQHIQNSKIGQLGLTDEVLKRYNATYQGLVQIVSDIRTICPLLTIARTQPSVPFYVVTQTGGDLNIADVDSDIQAILGRYEPKTFQQRRYVTAIQQLFYHYVSHGELKQYEPRRRVLDIGQDALSIEDYPNCDFWISKDIVPRYARLD